MIRERWKSLGPTCSEGSRPVPSIVRGDLYEISQWGARSNGPEARSLQKEELHGRAAKIVGRGRLKSISLSEKSKGGPCKRQ